MITRRELLKRTVAGGSAAAVAHLLPPALGRAYAGSQAGSAPADALATMRRQMAGTPVEVTRLTPWITVFSGPGGNVTVRHGDEGKVVIDTFVQGTFRDLKSRLDALGPTPILNVINTHWHFDHTDNNASFRELGVEIIAHENAKRRLTESHDLLGMHFSASPANALPTRTFAHVDTLRFDIPGIEEYVHIEHIAPAHTDGDLVVQFPLGEVLVLGDIFTNGMYPFIDAGTGGKVKGMLAAVDDALKIADPETTKVVPGHGAVGNRAALMAYRDMLGTVADRVQTLKAQGLPEREVVARKPTAEFDAKWGGGFLMPDVFVGVVYNTL